MKDAYYHDVTYQHLAEEGVSPKQIIELLEDLIDRIRGMDVIKAEYTVENILRTTEQYPITPATITPIGFTVTINVMGDRKKSWVERRKKL